jgi:sigma-E factor negative regulatory protein RseB
LAHIARQPRARLGASMAWAMAVFALPALAGSDDPRHWIARMNEALATRNYDGVFVHQLGASRETLRIIHRVKNRRMSERLISTDGSGREFVRSGREWVAYFPDRKLVIVENRRDNGFISTLRGLESGATDNYDVREIERTRIQGTQSRLITVTPRDAFRYGYRLWIDEKTGMPVKTQLASANNEVIEQITFVSLSFPKEVDDELLKPDVDASNFRWLRRDSVRMDGPLPVAFAPRTERLPPGFRAGKVEVPAANANARRSHFVFTDGLAWVSVFIERAEEAPQLSRQGLPRRMDGPVQLGASAAFTSRIEGYRVTAVGEVPPATAKAIAEAVRPE